MLYEKKIPMTQEEIKLIIKAVEDGELDYLEHFSEHPTATQNSRGAAIWDKINTHLINNFSVSGFKVHKIIRGMWSVIYVFDEKSKYLYTVMRTANFENLLKQKKKQHYINILSRLNRELLDYYETPYQQRSLFDLSTFLNISEEDQDLQLLMKSMIEKINEDIKRYAVILVDCRKGKVKNIECVIPITCDEPIYRENWNDCISADYDTERYHVDETLPGEDEILLNETNSDINLSIRTDGLTKKDKLQE